MKKNVIIILSIIIVFISVLFIIQSKKSTDISNLETTNEIPVIKVGHKTSLPYFLVFLARDEGYFQEAGIKVKFVEFKSTNQMIDAIFSGDIDVTGGGAYEPALAAELRSPGKLKFYYQIRWIPENHLDYIIVPKDSSLESIDNLKGKRLIVRPGASVTYTKLFLDQIGFNEQDVFIDQLEPKFHIQVLANKDADAVFTIEPVVTMALNQGVAKVLLAGPYSKYLPTVAGASGAGVISTDFINRYPDVAEKYVQVIEKTINLANSEPEKIRGILPSCCKVPPEVVQKIEHFGVYETMAKVDKKAVQNFADFLTENGVLKEKLYTNNMFYESK